MTPPIFATKRKQTTRYLKKRKRQPGCRSKISKRTKIQKYSNSDFTHAIKSPVSVAFIPKHGGCGATRDSARRRSKSDVPTSGVLTKSQNGSKAVVRNYALTNVSDNTFFFCRKPLTFFLFKAHWSQAWKTYRRADSKSNNFTNGGEHGKIIQAV